jgi:DNA gyrase/topoisomerase IV subunit A
MAKNFLTDEAVEKEIARLTATDAVKLARRELRLKYKRRQTLYNLRALEKRGKELQAAGIDMDNIDAMIAIAEQETNTEN